MKRLVAFLLALFTMVLAGAQDSNKNYILSKRMLSSNGSSHVDQVTYYDGIGRPVQTLYQAMQGTGAKKRLASLTEYDAYGRPVNVWRPVPVSAEFTSPSSLKSIATGTGGYSDSRPYTQTVYEASPLDRVTGTYGPGAAWASHGVMTDYLSNTASGELSCKLYTATSTALSGGTTNYAAGTLQVVKTTDEDGHVSYTFTDRLGRTVLSRQTGGNHLFGNQQTYDTYYVYDNAGNLRYVLQPEYQTTANLAKYAFQYTYDSHNRCIRKTLPGADYVTYEYNPKDQLTFSQDGNQRSHGKWTYYEYDGLGRLKEQGECTKSGSTATSKTIRVKNYYDNYNFRNQTGFNNSNFPADNTGYGKGYLTGSEITVLGTPTKLYTAYYYDVKGQVTKTVQSNLLNGYEVTTTGYTFTGQPQTVTHTHSASGKSSVTEVYTYTYDYEDRLIQVQHKLGSAQMTLAAYTYDNLGRVQTRKLHGSTTNQLTYSYNVRDWLTKISSGKFTQDLYYNTGSGTACYNGNISSMTWEAGNETTQRGYKFAYDGLNRLTSATYGEGTGISSNANRFTEKVTSYDKNGNIKGLQRYGQTSASAYGLIDNLTYTLDGNRSTRVDDAISTVAYNNGFEFKDAVKQANEYAYDANGNLTIDLNRNITEIQYNFLNLPSKVTFSDGSTITYTYAADGTKLRVVHTIGDTTTTTDYCGDVIYENGVRKYLLTDEGYVTLADNKYHYYLQDHQGNNRVVVDGNGTVEEVSHYYPFGGLFASSSGVQPYKYNGKELDTKNGLNWYDYGARMYDPALGRFTTVDPMAKDYYSWSPYAYCYDNPMKFIDPDGKKIVIGTFWQRFAATLGFENYVTKVTRQLKQNNMDSRRIESAYTQLENSEFVFRILPLSESPISAKKGNHVIPDNPVDVRDMKQGATMYYDPDMKITPNGTQREPRVGLAHETGHFVDYMNGESIPVNRVKAEDGDKVEIYKKELNERTPLEFENIIRKVLNDEERKEYYK